MSMTDNHKYELVFQSYYRVLVAFAASHYVTRTEAEDIVQDIFVKIWDKKYFVNITEDKLKSFLYTSVRNRAIDTLRKQKIRGGEGIEINENISTHETIESETINFEEEVVRSERLRSIYVAIEALPKQRKEIFKRIYFDEKDYATVAIDMGLSLNTVKVQMYRAYSKLRDILLLIILLIFFAKYL